MESTDFDSRAPSMEDVARLASVSVQTVSRVLNNRPNVSAKTHRLVEEAIQTLGYRRNTAARTLATRSSRILGVVSIGTSQLGQYETIRAVQEAAQDVEYFVSLANVRSQSATALVRAFDSLLEQSVDGIVVVAPHYEALSLIDGLPSRVPVVVVGPRGRFEFASVSIDQAAGARLAAEHLLELGHTKLVHISGPLDWLDAKLRLESWHAVLRSRGVDELPSIIGDWGAASGYTRTLDILLDGEATAIFVSNDQMALGALHALHRSGVRIPDDVSVVGFGDIEGAGFFEPALTTIRLDFDEIGRQCISVMSGLIGGGPRDAVVLEPALVVRDSTAPPRGARLPALSSRP